jgi:hypothetical protein
VVTVDQAAVDLMTQALEALVLVVLVQAVKVTLVVLVTPRQMKAEVVAVLVRVETTETLVVRVA